MQPSLDPAAATPSILIRDHGNCAEIHPGRDELLTGLLVERRRFRPDACGGLRREGEPEHLFDRDAGGGMDVPSGLVPRLADAARRAGYGVEIQDPADVPIAASAPEIAGLDDARRRLAEALARSRRGVVLARSYVERIAAIGLAVDLFATGRIMVVTTTRGEARKIGEALRVGRAEPVVCFTRQFTYSDVRVQVGTVGMDLTVAGIVVFADAAQALHERVRYKLLYLQRQRIYGLLDDRHRLSRRERLVIEGYVGPVIGGLGPPDDPPVEVRAVFAAWPGDERPDEPLGLAWKRGSVWDNDRRNEAIARLAAALAAGDMTAPWEYGLFLDGDPDLRSCAERRVAVLVESPEHARTLGRLLPGWRVLCADGADLGTVGRAGAAGMGPADRDDLPGRAIVTWLHARGRIEADVVIRADGLPWPLDLAVAPLRPGQAEARPVLLVDLADHQDRTARDATRARRLDYRDRGWIAQ